MFTMISTCMYVWVSALVGYVHCM